jgi:hypothetical protein
MVACTLYPCDPPLPKKRGVRMYSIVKMEIFKRKIRRVWWGSRGYKLFFKLIFQHYNSRKLRERSREDARFLQNRLYPRDPTHGIMPTSDKGYNVRGHRERKTSC